MVKNKYRGRDVARFVLAGIRLVTGGLGILAPSWLVRRLGADPARNLVALYAFRMFGVRTVSIGVTLLLPNDAVREHAVRTAPAIHASDTIAAAVASIHGPLPRQVAITIVLISSLNTVLAILAKSP